jgi:N-methylhydantoinase B/oxoprolinase/acetone carboxylase alpha subunit
VAEDDGTTLVRPQDTVTRTAHDVLVIGVGNAEQPAGSRPDLDQEPAPDRDQVLDPARDHELDQVTLSVINNHLATTCREMGQAMMRTSYSNIFNESLDFSCVLFNAGGEMIAQAEFCPSQIGTIRYTVRWTIQELGPERFQPGDVVVHNDPYRGGGHIPEHVTIKPVFYRDQLVAFVANDAHFAEVGGKAPGGLAGDATSVYEEGLRLPPVKIVERGQDVPDIWSIILANHRTPRMSYGDLKAMIGSLHVAEQRIVELIDRYGLVTFQRYTGALIALAERRMRAEIARIPDGEYTFEDVMEDDGVAGGPFAIRTRVVVRGDELIADFTGSSPQTRGPINCTYGVTASAVYTALLHLTDATIPRNDGCYRPITVIAPPGSIVNVTLPFPEVGGNTETNPRIVESIFGALAPVLPDRVAAAGGGTSSCFLVGGHHPVTEQPFAHFHFEGVGWGGRPTKDGNDVVIIVHGNCRNTPVEIFETRYPFRVLEYRLRADSAGPGRSRGGLGGTRLLEVLAPLTASALMERMRVPPWGLFGGRPAPGTGLYVRRKGTDTFRTFSEAFGTASPVKFSGIRLEPGDQVKIHFPGGGGYGDPLDRAPSRVLADVAEGYVSPERAASDYGAVVAEHDGEWVLDEGATRRRRTAMRGAPGAGPGARMP